MRRAKRKPDHGVVLATVLFLGIMMVAAVWATLSLAQTRDDIAAEALREDGLRSIAEGGLEWTVARLRRDPAFQGIDRRAFWIGSFDVVVTPVPGRPTLRKVRIVSRVPGPRTATSIAAFNGFLRQEERAAEWRRVTWTRDERVD